jgi:NAD(P)-dependent dehydrogenase (short-subunit alcohol dehydrogenase family)
MNATLITGANKGIGLELVKRYLEKGAGVVACCRQPERADALQALAAQAPTLLIEQLDVAEPSSVRALKQRLGMRPLDLVINNAGTAGPFLDKEPADGLDMEGWLDTYRVNTMAPLNILRQLRSNLAAGNNPRAVTVSPQMGAISFEMPNTMYAYCASKAALNKIMRMLAEDMKQDGIGVHLLHPGWVQTDMGGPDADLTAAESADGIVSVIETLGVTDAPRFVKWNGETHAW